MSISEKQKQNVTEAFFSLCGRHVLSLMTCGECVASCQAENSTAQPTTQQLSAVAKEDTNLLYFEADLHMMDAKKQQWQKGKQYV